MKKLGKEELAAIMAEHAKWLVDNSTGKQAYLVEYEITGETLPYGVILSYCTVSECTVSGGTVSECTVSDCTVSDCTVIYCKVSGCKVSYCKVSYCKVSDCTVSECTVSDCTVSDCTVSYCKVSGCKVSGGTVSGGTVKNKKLKTLRGFEGLYQYNVWSVLFEDGSRWVRMGCLFKSLEDWEKEGGIRKSNLSQFPDDGSDVSEERVRAFEFAKATALALK